MDYKTKYCYLTLMLIMLGIFFVPSYGDTTSQILIRFRSFLSNSSALNNWVEADESNLCSWAGLLCTNQNQAFYGLRLENMGLGGKIDVETLLELTDLVSFSVMNNNFQGPMPEFKKLVKLRALFLSNNNFSGEILDDGFDGMKNLKRVVLAENRFIGHIPLSLANLPRLLDLDLHGNGFEGNIPEFQQHGFRVFDLSNNQLEGSIPESLSNEPLSSFSGNKGLCGKPLSNPCTINSPTKSIVTPLHQGKTKKHKKFLIAIIAVLVTLVLASIVALLFIQSRRRRKRLQLQPTFGLQNSKDAQSVDLTSEFKKNELGDLNFVGKDKGSFDLQGLLRASAEVLGSGSFGSTYKAIVLNGPTVVVKRFRHMNNVGKHEFFEHMKKLGNLTHPNLLPLVAFYYRKDEKFLVYEFGENGSLASHLHGRSSSLLTWPTRLKIIKGVARGLAYLYKEFPTPQNLLPHGHLKSSNIILNHSFEPCLTEYGLVPVINKNHAQQFMSSYKSPEVTQHETPTSKTDVWCLGILILELLTGKFPANYLRHGKGVSGDLGTWVNSVVREEWTGEVFDKNMMKGGMVRNGEGEMLKLLRIGMYCCEWGVDSRWDWKEALEKIEELKEKDCEDEYSSYSYVSTEGDMYSRNMTDEEEFSFPLNDSKVV